MSEESMQQRWATSYLSGGNAAYVEGMYEAYLNDPNSVPAEWQAYFANDQQTNGQIDISHDAIREQFLQLARQGGARAHNGLATDMLQVEKERKQAEVWRLISIYRRLGHQLADLDPLGLAERIDMPSLDIKFYGLTDADLDTEFATGDFLGLGESARLRDLLAALKQTYCGHIGIEYLHITEPKETLWLRERIEPNCGQPQIANEKKLQLLDELVAAEGLEKYLATKYVGQKRFGLEGAESIIPALRELTLLAGSQGVQDCVIGMAHRGRLNVLVNILGKSPSELFDEFEGKSSIEGTGDVKYHQGFSSSIDTPGGSLHLALSFNPSHLEIIDPVVEGSVRARQERRNDTERDKVLPILIHGDAAFAGQGVVMETFALSQARGYRTGGTVHFIINNQIGFTTSNPLDARSSLYCTDIAKMVQAPVLHVNADDPEAVIFATQLAFDFRMEFKKDIVVDLVCYRRHGHNEADEPSITQPTRYQTIKKHHPVTKLYADQLVQEGLIDAKHSKTKAEAYRSKLDAGQPVIKVTPGASSDKRAVDWTPYLGQKLSTQAHTAVSASKLRAVAKELHKLPDDFTLQPQVAREMQNRNKMLDGELDLNWGCAETLAYATLVSEGFPVRLSGQDSGRGTFSHRHATLHDQYSKYVYVPLQHVAPHQANFTVINSVLSEVAVLGFEYGYASTEPNALVIWEAQFGDFANGAQVVIDQFISSGEQKWGRLCGLTLYLPHGYEGQGPEHSSARLERYLQLCAQHNMQVCSPTTPAQIFHLLRRQMLRPARKPLIIMTPKSLLRHKLATSPLKSLTDGKFHLVIPEVDNLPVEQVKRVVLCSGKVYYDLLEERRRLQREDVAIMRIEQIYPFPQEELNAELARYVQAKQIIWCQEEPMNQGAWYATQHRLQNCLSTGQTLAYVGREHFAAPAVGVFSVHKDQQERLVKEALG